VGWQRRVNQL